ncbi:MAG: alpha/beta fold hydrolase [Bacteroidota bacterium]
MGKGEPLLILHGFLGMGDNWKTLGNRYAENGFEVYLIDQRNHGRSFWAETFHYNTLAEDLYDFLTHHQVGKAHILGHSMGGKTAMQLACSHPKMVHKLIVADIAPKYYPPHHQHIFDALNALDLSTMRSRSEVDEALANYISDSGIRQFLLKNLYRKDKDRFAFRCNLAVLRHKMEEVGEKIGDSQRYNGPTLFLRGERSDYISHEDMGAIKTHFPLSNLDTIPNAGHWLHAENPGQFLEKSLEFLTS